VREKQRCWLHGLAKENVEKMYIIVKVCQRQISGNSGAAALEACMTGLNDIYSHVHAVPRIHRTKDPHHNKNTFHKLGRSTTERGKRSTSRSRITERKKTIFTQRQMGAAERQVPIILSMSAYRQNVLGSLSLRAIRRPTPSRNSNQQSFLLTKKPKKGTLVDTVQKNERKKTRRVESKEYEILPSTCPPQSVQVCTVRYTLSHTKLLEKKSAPQKKRDAIERNPYVPFPPIRKNN
jgi:hypothetical protein